VVFVQRVDEQHALQQCDEIAAAAAAAAVPSLINITKAEPLNLRL
jgi:hypothetical protein